MGWIKGVMIVSGLLTMTMLSAAVSPGRALQSTFGTTLEGPTAEIVVRNWGLLIALVGAMLVYGAFHPAVRTLVLTVASVSKLGFVALLLVWGRSLLAGPAGVVVISDVLQVLLLGGCLAVVLGRRPRPDRP